MPDALPWVIDQKLEYDVGKALAQRIKEESVCMENKISQMSAENCQIPEQSTRDDQQAAIECHQV